jgi:hypothetical protein
MAVLSLQHVGRKQPSAICLIQEIESAADRLLCWPLLLLPAASRPIGGIACCLPANRLLLLLLLAPSLLLLPSACSACSLLLLLLVLLSASCCQLFAPPALCWCELGSCHQLHQ